MKLACWQAPHLGGAGHLDRLADAAERAAARGVDLLVTPELSLVGYGGDADELASAAERFGELTERAAGIARDTGVALVYGVPEPTGDGRSHYNTACLVDRRGTTLARHRKTHLYGPWEDAVFTPGDDPVTQCTLGGLTVGLLICYEVEFPELVRAHALRGTELLAVPTALNGPWELVATTLVPTRAFENQLYLGYANWSGGSGGARFPGLSTLVRPSGQARSLDPGGDPLAGELLTIDVDPAEVAAARARTSYLADRRPALYRDLTSGHDALAVPGGAR